MPTAVHPPPGAQLTPRIMLKNPGGNVPEVVSGANAVVVQDVPDMLAAKDETSLGTLSSTPTAVHELKDRHEIPERRGYMYLEVSGTTF